MNKHTESDNSHTNTLAIDIPSNNLITVPTCSICLSNFDDSLSHSFGKCNHIFCEQCTLLYIDSQLSEEKLIKCPRQNCSSILDQQSTLISTLPEQKQRKYFKIQKRSKNPTIIFCNTPNCLGDISLNPRLSNCLGIINYFKGLLQCNTCMTLHCSNCSLHAHPGACMISDKSKDHQMIKSLKQNYLFRKCGRCNMVVEKNEGCDHITCKCKFQFCYVCGRDYTIHTCTFIEESHQPILQRIFWTCIFVLLMVVLFPVDLLLTFLLLLAPISALIAVPPLALILGFVKMKDSRCHIILIGNVFLLLACIISSIPKAFKWYWKQVIPSWLSAIQYCHLSCIFIKITRMLIYKLPVPCNNRKEVAPQAEAGAVPAPAVNHVLV